jgi:hypothetical protein
MGGGGTAATLRNLAGGEWSAQHSSHSTPGKDLLPIVQEDGWASGSGAIEI